MSHVGTSHVTRHMTRSKSRHVHECVMWHLWMSATWLGNTTWDMTHSYGCEMPSFFVSNMTHTYVCDLTSSHHVVCYFVRLHDETWLYHMCDMTHSYVRHDSLICVTYVCDMVRGQVTWRDMTHLYVQLYSRNITDIHLCDSIWSTPLQLLTWLIHICVTWLIVTSLICVPRLIHMCVIWLRRHDCSCWHWWRDSFIYAVRDSLIYVTWLIRV